MTDAPIQKLSQALYRVTGQQLKDSGENQQVRCPAHEDDTPSLTIGTGQDGKVLVDCKTGCSTEAVCHALGLTLADLMPSHDRSRAPKKLANSEADTRNAVYSALLAILPLDQHHRKDLHKRGLSDAEIDRRSYRTQRAGRAVWMPPMEEKFLLEVLLSVPGFYICPKIKQLSFAGPAGLLIPVRDLQGRIIGLQIRPDKPGKKGAKYIWASSKKYDGPGPGSLPHVPLDVVVPAELVRITEGPLKGDVAMIFSGLPTISFAGVSSWKSILPLLEALQSKTVHLAFDADFRNKKPVAGKLRECARHLAETGYSIVLETWKIEDGKGIDDLLANGKQPAFLKGGDAMDAIEETAKTLGLDECTGRREITISTDEFLTNDAAAAALPNVDSLFVWLDALAQVVTSDSTDGINREKSAPRVQGIGTATLREMLTRVCRFVKVKESEEIVEGDPVETTPAHPPAWCVQAVQARGHWPGVRNLAGLVTSPVLRPDGSILNEPGYDAATGLFYHPTDSNAVVIPTNPTRNDAMRAVAKLRELVCDFPFAEPVHEIAFLAALLTPLGWHAFPGPAPLFLMDANTRGSGKSLLADIIGIVAAGGNMPRFSNTHNDEEVRKRITAIALAGDSLCLIDNIAGQLGSASLDAALTAIRWKDRILQESRIVECPLNVTWFATGNNVTLGADTSRRVLPIRLESPAERPEEREGFQIPDILTHVRQNRGEYLAAGLTILSAYFASGKAAIKIPAWGSYEGWSSIVRATLVWLGLPDPIQARRGIVESSDRMAQALGLILSAWADLDPDCNGLTMAAAIKRLQGEPEKYADAREKLLEACPPKGNAEFPTGRALGYLFRSIKRRVCGGRYLDCESGHGNTNRWCVRPAETLRSSDGGDGGDGGHDSRPGEMDFPATDPEPAPKRNNQSATAADHHPHRPHHIRDAGDWGEL